MQSIIRRTSFANKSSHDVKAKRECPIGPIGTIGPISATRPVDFSNTNARPKKRRTLRKRKHLVPSMTDLIIPKISFKRVVKEILAKRSKVMQIKRSAVAVLHEQTENMLHGMFVNTKLVADTQGTNVIRLPHMKLMYALTKIKGPPSRVVKIESDIISPVTIPLPDEVESMPTENNINDNDNDTEDEYEDEDTEDEDTEDEDEDTEDEDEDVDVDED
jgi:histone H3/H4